MPLQQKKHYDARCYDKKHEYEISRRVRGISQFTSSRRVSLTLHAVIAHSADLTSIGVHDLTLRHALLLNVDCEQHNA